MRIMFLGSAESACPCLDRIRTGTKDILAGVVTQPDRPKGRSLKTASCAVRSHLKNISIPIFTPTDINTPESVRAIRELSPDLIVVVAYGQILKSCILEIPPRGCINVHASLLPKYRGAAPVQWAVALGDKLTGVTMMYVNEAMDAGDIIDQIEEPIRDDDTDRSLNDRLAQRGADLLTRTLDAIRQGTVHRVPQNNTKATFAPKLKKIDGRMDWSKSAKELNNRIRGFNSRPGCFFKIEGDRSVRVFKAKLEEGSGVPGTILDVRGTGPLIQTGNQSLRLLELQPEGRKIMSGSSFLCGYSMKKDDRLL